MQYEYTIPFDDQTSVNGFKMKCGDLITGDNSSEVMVYKGIWGNFLPMIPVPTGFGVCGG